MILKIKYVKCYNSSIIIDNQLFDEFFTSPKYFVTILTRYYINQCVFSFVFGIYHFFSNKHCYRLLYSILKATV